MGGLARGTRHAGVFGLGRGAGCVGVVLPGGLDRARGCRKGKAPGLGGCWTSRGRVQCDLLIPVVQGDEVEVGNLHCRPDLGERHSG